jgi:peptidoglycan/LPS O-acetylase OafA/YrhL
MPQLDSVRAIAVLLVMFAHYGGPFSLWMARHGLDCGAAGVRLFFVLSGFLITGIILRKRDLRAACRERLNGRALRQFYARRALRICPLYYGILLLAFAVGVRAVRDNALWHFSCLSNWSGRTMGVSSHFWSLCVEAQFYLLWPLAAFTFSAPRLQTSLLPLWLLSLLGAGVIPNELVARSAFSFAFLGFGCWLAVRCFVVQTPLRRRAVRPRPLLLAALFLLLCAFAGRSIFAQAQRTSEVLAGLSEACLFLWAIEGAALGFSGLAGSVLSTGPLRYLGTISYGVYAYHLFMPALAIWILARLDWTCAPALRNGACALATFLVAAISWEFYERPILAFKPRATPDR